MKGTLVKREDRYDLYNESDGSKIASTAPNPQSRLSIINCESIEKGYSIEEIDALFKKVPHTVQNEEDYWKCRAGFITGFQTAMEILGDKKFSENEANKIWKAGQEYWKTSGESITFEELIERRNELLQQTEWDCIVEMEGFVDEEGIYCGERPKLDVENCLILKRK